MTEKTISFTLNKIVRDKLPDMMRDIGQEPEVSELKGEDLVRALIAKVGEELSELDPTDPSYQKELSEVKQAIVDLIEISGGDDVIEELRLTDLEKRGGFARGQFVSTLHLTAEDPWVEYYRRTPERYKEL